MQALDTHRASRLPRVAAVMMSGFLNFCFIFFGFFSLLTYLIGCTILSTITCLRWMRNCERSEEAPDLSVGVDAIVHL